MSLLLRAPTPGDEKMIIDFAREFRAAGGDHVYGSGGLLRYPDYAAWFKSLSQPQPGRIPQNVYISMDGDTMVGFICIREKADPEAGHIGYSVRPSCRKRGYGKAQLRLALDICARRGDKFVMVTCDEDNLASAKVISAFDGVECSPIYDNGHVERRFWVATRPADYADVNSRVWDLWVDGGIDWGKPVSHEEYERARTGEWGVHLSSVKHVPKAWFPEMKGAKVLCLAGGGGQQAPIFTALGAKCTVFDNSERQLAMDKFVAQREGYEIELIKGDMTRKLPFADGAFDLVFSPVSNCYIDNVYHVWRECYRVLKPGGILLAGMDNGIGFLFSDSENLTVDNYLPVNPIRDGAAITDDEGVQFSHTLEEQLGGQMRAGFRLTDLIDDYERPGGKLGAHTPLYILTRAVKD